MELLKRLTHTHSVSGNEEDVCKLIKEEISPYCDEVYIDSLNSLVAHKKGNGKKVMLCAHTDEIGFMVNYIEDKGFIRFSLVGGVDLNSALGQRVVFKNGVEGVVASSMDKKTDEALKCSNMYIDINTSSKEETLKKVSYGDTASFKGNFTHNDRCIISKSLDNKLGVYALIKAIKMLKDTTLDLYFVFSSQEEIGLRGAKVATYSIEPDICINVDITSCDDVVGSLNTTIDISKGVCIKIMDNSVITNKDLRDEMERICIQNGIDYQFEILSFGGTDAGVMQRSKKGSITGALSIPIRYVHTSNEMADTKTVNDCINLIYEICKKDFILD